MPAEASKWVKPARHGRHKGAQVSIDQESWEWMLLHSNIPVNTPMDELRITRYPTKKGTIILKVKLLKDISQEEL